MPKSRRNPPEICPVCGAEVPPNARACPECGADESAGWDEDATTADGLDLPDEEFDYEEFTRREFGGARTPPARRGLRWILLALIALAIAAVFLMTALR